jgi:hypothetical protein
MPNNIFLNRLQIITDNGEIAFDELFHKGVNIIRGDNSSGKSTITHFIFYVLGGAFKDFVPEARLCSLVIAEVEINNAIFTIKRAIEKDDKGNVNTQSPLFFYWGAMEESFKPPIGKGWQKFGYKSTDQRKSFSNVLFECLDLPIVKGDTNITIHQILRLLYIDQDSPTSSLFLYEHFDSQLTRETVSDLLLGVYDEELYENKKRLILAEKEFDGIKNEIRATANFFSDPNSRNQSHLTTAIQDRELEISSIQDEIIAIRNKEKEIVFGEDSKLTFQILTDSAITQRKIVVELEEQISLLKYEIEDSIFFIDTLNRKIKALKNSIQTREFLGNLPLEICPECLSKIKSNNDATKCKLCKEQIDETFGVVQARRMELEIGFQINESQRLLELNKRDLLELESRCTAEIGKLQDLQKQVNNALEDVKSFNEETIDSLNSKKGFIEGEILQFRTMLENAALYDKLIQKKNQLENEIGYLKDYVNKTEKAQAKLKEAINEKIREEGVYLLNNDLDRQDEFKKASDFIIDFSNNISFLSSKFSRYSASSNFYLKVSARFSIFLASLHIDQMRFPRFIFADNMEDKGIEMKRAQNLQKLLIDRVSSYSATSYQMIYTTSYITDELNKSNLVVGEYYTKENPSLKNIRK